MRFFTAKTTFLRANCCQVPAGYVIFRAIFVNLLVFNGLASELPPIDRKKTDFKVSFGHSLRYRYQPDLRILTRSTGSSPPRDVTSRRLVHPSFPHSQLDPPNDRRKLTRGLVYPGIFGLPARQAAPGSMGIRAEIVLGPGGGAGGGRDTWGRFFEAGDLHLHRFWRRESALGSGDLSEPDHFSGGFFHRTGCAGSRDSEQLPCFRTTGIHTDIFQSDCQSVFHSASCTGRSCGGRLRLTRLRRSRWELEFC